MARCEHVHKDSPDNAVCSDCYRRRLIIQEVFYDLEATSYVYADITTFPVDPKKRDEAIKEHRRRVFKEKEFKEIKNKFLGTDEA